jgi:DNA repair protein RecO (recombination protein O)
LQDASAGRNSVERESAGREGVQTIEIALRKFELDLLASIGYGYDWMLEADTGRAISPEKYYRFDHQHGFVSGFESADKTRVSETSIPGSVLLSLAQGEFKTASTCQYAKLIVRQMLKPLLGDKPIKARELFV